ncbi:MAG: hypothetical protein HY822_14260 [Acidobacteria bacterium]|nr:hypothetical protein [Acidobacteriota bacterium]
MRQSGEFFSEQELALVFIAKKLKEALRAESELTSAGFDYLVETDTYHGGLIFQSQRVGAFFYVLPAVENAARELLSSRGFRPYNPVC